MIKFLLVGAGGFIGSVLRYGVSGLEGFGASSRIHSASILRLSEDLPVVVEIVDTSERIKEFLDVVDSVVTGGLATVEKVQIHFYRGREKDTKR
jgi:PII-like signaling protein